MPEPVAPASPTSLEQALATSDLLERRQSLELIGFNQAKTDVDAAIASLDQVRLPRDREAMIRGIFHFLSAQDPASALQKIAKLSAGSDRITARQELLAAWAPTQAENTERNGYLLSRFGAGGLGMQLMMGSPPRTDLAILWAKELDPTEGRARMLTEIAHVMAATSPQEALKLGEGMEGEDYLRFLSKFSDGWAAKDGKAALDWSMQIGDPVLRENLQQSINSTWANSDLENAKNQLATMPQGPSRDSLLRAVAEKIADGDTAAALAFVQGLPTAADQRIAGQVVQSVTPVGIGAQLSVQDGLPVITSLLPGAAAALSQQLQTGDRILGVDTNDGEGFVSTNGVDLGRVVDLIRGQPGTSVRLQVAKVNSFGFDPPRVITLPRLQLTKSPSG